MANEGRHLPESRRAPSPRIAPSAPSFAIARSRQGQAAIEFLAYLSIFLLLFVVAMIVFFSLQAREARDREFQLASEHGRHFATRIQTALSVGDGFQARYAMPEIASYPGARVYVPENDPGKVFFEWRDTSGLNVSYPYSYGTRNVMLDLRPGNNATGGGEYRVLFNTSVRTFTIRNSNGTIYLSQP